MPPIVIGAYRNWVFANHPEMGRDLWAGPAVIGLTPDTVAIHRSLIAEWRAQG